MTFRKLAIECCRPYSEAALLLSGGVDSATMLAALLSEGVKPSVFTFRLSGYESSDFKVARDMAREFGLPFHPVIIPQTVDALINDVYRVIRLIRTGRKTHIQCCHPMLYVADAVREAGLTTAIWASTLDFVFGSNRRAQVALRAGGQEAFTAYRRKAAADPDSSDASIEATFASRGVALRDPFNNPALIEFMLERTSNDMHYKMQKGIAVRAFPEFWQRGAWYRPHDSYQINSRLREFHDVLLSQPINRRKSRAVVAIYNDILTEVEHE